jgi:hypothetical protein
MTLAEFYATHRSPQAIIVTRRTIRLGSARRAGPGAGSAEPKPAVSSATPLPGAADKKH